MKRITILMFALVFACGVVAAPDASAGLFKKSKSKRTEKPEWMKKAQRYEDVAVMSFHAGTLQQDGWTGWKLGETKIHFAKDCSIVSGDDLSGKLDAGRKAIVMGPKIGDTIVAWSVRVAKPDFSLGRTIGSEVQLQVSETDPDCGEIIQAPF